MVFTAWNRFAKAGLSVLTLFETRSSREARRFWQWEVWRYWNAEESSRKFPLLTERLLESEFLLLILSMVLAMIFNKNSVVWSKTNAPSNLVWIRLRYCTMSELWCFWSLHQAVECFIKIWSVFQHNCIWIGACQNHQFRFLRVGNLGLGGFEVSH